MSATASPALTPLGYALLCEVQKAPRSGYALRRLFETTPMGIFSSSPGSIYPALKRLEEHGLIHATGAGRGAHLAITRRGDAVLDAWLAEPVTLADVSGRIELCLLRFAFLEGHPDPSLALRFLVSLAAAAEERDAELAAFLDSEEGRALPLLGRLAVEHGRRSIRATGHWAIDARRHLVDQSDGDSL